MTAKARAIPEYTVLRAGAAYVVCRDGAALKTPAGVELIVPTMPLADAIAEEWRAQKGKPDPLSMPMMQLAATSIDITRKNRDAVIEQVVGYASGDLLCFRAESPDELVRRQHEVWQPILDWCAKRFGAKLRTGQGIMPVTQPPEALHALRRIVENLDDFALTGVKQAAEVSGSLVLALALAERHLAAEQIFHAAELDAHFQMEKWGNDPALVKRHESIRGDLVVCERWFGLVR